MSDEEHWENIYIKTAPQELPWNAGGPDSDLVRLVQSGRIPTGQALDIGTGPGHDAVFLIQQGFNVIAIDLSESAIRLARENASHAGLFGFFQKGDIRRIPIEDGFIDFANDRGCFHVLDENDRRSAAREVARVLRPGGLFLLRVFSDQEPGRDGPHRFSRLELDQLFEREFRILDFWAGRFEGPRRPHSYSMLMQKV
ncbi:MAG TPA: class I SAM-dependent methyltransferase [Elusimicrobiota bacterium]|nr:class I SAM-dependent methyltransferase [Elusimicrobiota bacterium]